MRRLKTPWHGIQRLQHQLLKVAELRLAQAQAALQTCDARITQVTTLLAECERQVLEQFDRARQLRPGDLLATRAQLEDARRQVREEQARREELRKQLNVRQADFRDRKARCEGLDRLVQQQYHEHRRLAQSTEQDRLDDTARVMRSLVADGDDQAGE